MFGPLSTGLGGPESVAAAAAGTTGTASAIGTSISFVPSTGAVAGGAGVSGVTSASAQQQHGAIKAIKKRKEGGAGAPNSFDSVVNRDEVQSPAYSDISDDSAPVAENDPNGKRLCFVCFLVRSLMYRCVYCSYRSNAATAETQRSGYEIHGWRRWPATTTRCRTRQLPHVSILYTVTVYCVHDAGERTFQRNGQNAGGQPATVALAGR